MGQSARKRRRLRELFQLVRQGKDIGDVELDAGGEFVHSEGVVWGVLEFL